MCVAMDLHMCECELMSKELSWILTKRHVLMSAYLYSQSVIKLAV